MRSHAEVMRVESVVAASTMDLRLRLNVLLVLIFAITLAVGVVYLFGNVRQSITAELDASSDLAEILLRGVVAESRGDALALAGVVERVHHDPVIRHLSIAVLPASAAVPAAEARVADAPVWFARLAQPAPGALVRRVATPGGDILIVADAADEIGEAWREARSTLFVLVIAFAAVNLVSFVFLGRALAPLAQLSRALRGVEQGDFTARLPRLGLADVDRLSERFNDMASALARSHRENAALAQRSLAIQEEERRHLAHELHDELGQSITAIKALAVSIGERVQPIDAALAERAATIVDVSSDIYARVRRMMAQLHPVVLDELGLAAALAAMIDDWNAHHEDSFCASSIARTLPPLAPATRVGIYRVVQEALTNIARHAGPCQARIALVVEAASAGPAELMLTVRDDGRGFDPLGQLRGLGLRGMQERVAALGGTLHVDTRPGAGVTLCARVPATPRAPAIDVG